MPASSRHAVLKGGRSSPENRSALSARNTDESPAGVAKSAAVAGHCEPSGPGSNRESTMCCSHRTPAATCPISSRALRSSRSADLAMRGSSRVLAGISDLTHRATQYHWLPRASHGESDRYRALSLRGYSARRPVAQRASRKCAPPTPTALFQHPSEQQQQLSEWLAFVVHATHRHVQAVLHSECPAPRDGWPTSESGGPPPVPPAPSRRKRLGA